MGDISLKMSRLLIGLNIENNLQENNLINETLSEQMTEKALIEAFFVEIRQNRKRGSYGIGDEENFWAIDTVNNGIDYGPEHLGFIAKLIDGCNTDEEIAYVAAGPLETLFRKHHLSLKKPLSAIVRKEAKMRKAIQAIFCQENTPARKTLDEILSQYGLRYASL